MAVSRLFYILDEFLALRAKDCESRMTAFAVFVTVAPLFFYILNSQIYSQAHYDTFVLRAIVIIFGVCILLRNYWPLRLRRWLPWLWYVSVLYAFPFFITFMTLKNQVSPAWVLNDLGVLILTMLLVDWLMYAILLILGVAMAWVAFLLTTNAPFHFFVGSLSYIDVINTFSITVIMGLVFLRKKEILERGKIEAMKSISATIAHELRTPLASINLSVGGLKNYLPKLIGAYKKAQEHNLDIDVIRSSQFVKLSGMLDRVETEVNFSNNFINMLLIKADPAAVEIDVLEEQSASDVISAAMERYPFHDNELKIIHYDGKVDFQFNGNQLLLIHVLFNLFKNAFHYVSVAGKGDVLLWCEKGKGMNELHVRDTGAGIPSKMLPQIFDRFFSETKHGSGVGLAYCKMVMEAFGGKIKVDSVEGEYTEIVLYFPKLD